MANRVRRWTGLLVCALGTFVPRPATSQAPISPGATADSRDVATADAVVATLYDVISGPAGQKRNWDRFRSLFAPGARLIPTSVGADGIGHIRVLTPDDYATLVGPRLEEGGFFEREIGRTIDTFGKVTQLFSAYESRRTAADEKPFARGINSIQLLNDGARWWVVSIYWDSERGDNPIPAKYLKPRP